MAATLTSVFNKAGDGFLIRAGTGNLGVYATGGIAPDPRQIGLGRFDSLIVGNSGNYRFAYIRSTGKVIAYTDDGTSGISAEVADTTDLSAVTFEFLAHGAY